MERSSHADRDYGAVGKTSRVHDAFGVVPGKQTLTMGLDAAMPAPADAPLVRSSDATRLRDGINLEGGGTSLVDKTTAETSGTALAGAAAAGAETSPGQMHDQVGSGGTGSGGTGSAGT